VRMHNSVHLTFGRCGSDRYKIIYEHTSRFCLRQLSCAPPASRPLRCRLGPRPWLRELARCASWPGARAGQVRQLARCASWPGAPAGQVRELARCASWPGAPAGQVRELARCASWPGARAGQVRELARCASWPGAPAGQVRWCCWPWGPDSLCAGGLWQEKRRDTDGGPAGMGAAGTLRRHRLRRRWASGECEGWCGAGDEYWLRPLAPEDWLRRGA
jgi:hypothetical protein